MNKSRVLGLVLFAYFFSGCSTISSNENVRRAVASQSDVDSKINDLIQRMDVLEGRTPSACFIAVQTGKAALVKDGKIITEEIDKIIPLFIDYLDGKACSNQKEPINCELSSIKVKDKWQHQIYVENALEYHVPIASTGDSAITSRWIQVLKQKGVCR